LPDGNAPDIPATLLRKANIELFLVNATVVGQRRVSPGSNSAAGTEIEQLQSVTSGPLPVRRPDRPLASALHPALPPKLPTARLQTLVHYFREHRT
jgi:hypothetical protein